MDEDRVTAPENPLTGEAVMVEAPVAPASIDRPATLAAREKSWMVKVTVAEWDANAPLAIIVTM